MWIACALPRIRTGNPRHLKTMPLPIGPEGRRPCPRTGRVGKTRPPMEYRVVLVARHTHLSLRLQRLGQGVFSCKPDLPRRLGFTANKTPVFVHETSEAS